MKNIKIINGDDLRIIALKSAEELGDKINLNIQASRNTETNYLVKVETPRFANSEGKAKILETVRGKDVFILTDVGNYSIKYTMFGEENKMSYDDHYQDLKRVINATAATANRIWAVMPLLYSSRQHKREGRESLDCAMALQELEFFGVKGIITFDAHDPGVRSALNKTSFDNIYPTHSLINEFLDSEEDKISSELKKDKSVKDVDTNIAGRTLDIVITVDDDMKLDDAKKVGSNSYKVLSEKQIDYYSIQVFIKKNSEKENNFPIIGYKQRGTKDLVWTKDRKVTE